MCPIYAVLAAPLARPLGTRVLLWYAHWNRTRMLEARRAGLEPRAVASIERSVPVTSAKVVGIGHGIDVSDFTCAEGLRRAPFRLAALGRYSAAKGLDTIIRAVALARAEGSTSGCASTAPPPAQPRRATLERASRARDRARRAPGRSSSAARSRAPRSRPCSRPRTRSSTTCAPGAPDKVVYEALRRAGR